MYGISPIKERRESLMLKIQEVLHGIVVISQEELDSSGALWSSFLPILQLINVLSPPKVMRNATSTPGGVKAMKRIY